MQCSFWQRHSQLVALGSALLIAGCGVGGGDGSVAGGANSGNSSGGQSSGGTSSGGRSSGGTSSGGQSSGGQSSGGRSSGGTSSGGQSSGGQSSGGMSSGGQSSGGQSSGGTSSGGQSSGGTSSGGQSRGGTSSGGQSSGGTTAGAVFRVNSAGRVTRNGTVFPVRCGSWFGLQGRYEPENKGAPMEQYLGNTSWVNGGQGSGRTIAQTMKEISDLGINVVRLPVVHQTLDANDPMGKDPYLKNHSSVRIPNSRAALEQWIKVAAQFNVQVLLDIHSCSNYVDWRKGRLDARPPWVDATRDNYTSTREDCSCAPDLNPSSVTRVQAYNETIWLQDLKILAGLGKQLGVDNIIGIDIFNEPWDYTWQEWKTLSEHAYQAINEVNPNILIWVQGISKSAGNQDGSPQSTTPVPHGNPDLNPNWGENLYEAGNDPPNIPKDRLVYSPHTYGPSVAVQPMFMDPKQPACKGMEGDPAGDAKCQIVIDPKILRPGWEEHFGYLKDKGYAVIVGEFGGNWDWPLGQASQRDRNRFAYLNDKTVDAQWQKAFVDYMVEKGIEGCYWSINPESGDTAGIYGHAYDPVSNPSGWGEWRSFDTRKTALLKKLWGM